MNKKSIFILVPCILSASITTNKPSITNYDYIRNQKVIASYMGDFNHISESLSYNTDTKKHNVVNEFSIGPISYSVGNTSHKISLSKNIKDFYNASYLVKYNLNLKDYYDRISEDLQYYSNFLDAYTNYILQFKNIENNKFLLETLKLDENIIEEKYKNGLVSEIDYQSIKLQIASSELQLLESKNLLEQAKKTLKGFNYTIEDNEDFDVPSLNIVKLKTYINFYNSNIDNTNNYLSNINYKNKVDHYSPDIYFDASYDIKEKNASIGIRVSKSFDILANFIPEKKDIKTSKLILEDEIELYNLLKNQYDISLKKEELAKKELDIARLKLKLGKITNREYMEKIIAYSNSQKMSLDAKIKLTKNILLKEL